MSDPDAEAMRRMLVTAYKMVGTDTLKLEGVTDTREVRIYHIGFRDALVQVLRQVQCLKDIRVKMAQDDWPEGIRRIL